MYLRHGLSAGVLACLTSLTIVSSSVSAQSPAGASTTKLDQVTFTKDVLPILQEKCQTCHRPGSIAPMSLMTYRDARPWARAIKQNVESRVMPPWYIDRRVGVQKFKDDPSLTDREIATIAAWVDNGALEGNAADASPAKEFPDPNEWRIGEPDLVVSMPEPYVLPAQGADAFPNIDLDPKLTEDRYIKAVEIKPDPLSQRVVHHAVTHMTDFDKDIVRGNFLNEYAIGKNGDIFAEDTGRLIKAGTKITLGLHVHPYGEEIPVRVRLGLQLYPKGYKPKYVLVSQHMGDNDDLLLPAGESNIRHDGYTLLAKPAVITGFQPHMHNRGKAQCMEAIVPPTDEDGKVVTDGPAPIMRVVTLSCTPRWYFNWHLVYNYADDVAPVLPAGTVIHVTTWHDNSASLKSNPDPRNNIVYGQRTIDEMSFAWVNYYYIDDDDYRARVAVQKAQRATNKR